MAINWLVIGLILATELLFGIGYAFLTRHVSKEGPHGQTAWLVVVGVAVVIVIGSPALGLEKVSLLAAFFFMAGLPMVVEYLNRVAHEEHEARDVQEKSLDVDTSADR